MNIYNKYLLLTSKVLVSVAFLGAGASKLAGVEMMVATFDQIGFGQWFRYIKGIIEIGSVVLLWRPSTNIRCGLAGMHHVWCRIGTLFYSWFFSSSCYRTRFTFFLHYLLL